MSRKRSRERPRSRWENNNKIILDEHGIKVHRIEMAEDSLVAGI
jgi:hypothetical protein